MRVKDKLISNTTYLFLDWIFIFLFSMFFWFIIAKTLSPGSYGVIATSIQIHLFFSHLSLLGLGPAARKLIPEFSGKRKKDKVRGLIKYSLKIVTITSLGIALVLILFSSRITPYLKLEPEIIWIISCLIVLGSIAAILGTFYHGFQNMKKFFLTNFFGHLMKVIFPLIFIFLGFGYFGPLIGLAICYLVMIITRFDKNFFSSKKSTLDKKRILKFSIPSFITTIFSVIFDNTKYIILTLVKTIETTGFFALAGTVSLFIHIIPNVLSTALFPIISGLDTAKNKKTRRNYLIRLGFRYSLFIILPIAVYMILFSKYIILFFSGPDYLPSVIFLPFLTLAAIFLGLGNFFLSNLFAIGKPNVQKNVQIISTLIYLFTAIPLTYYFSGIGLAVSYLFTTTIILSLGFIYMKKFSDLTLPFGDIGRIILATVCSTLFLILCRPFVDNFWVAGILMPFAGLIYILVLLKLNFYLKEDLMVLDFLTDRLPIFKKQIKSLRNYFSTFVRRSYRS